MNIVERAKNIVLEPAREWPVIAGEPIDTKALFLGYAAPLAAIGPIASWLGHSVIGVSVPLFGTVRTPFMTGLAFAIVTYGLVLAGVFVVGLIIDALAPSFGGEKNAGQAMVRRTPIRRRGSPASSIFPVLGCSPPGVALRHLPLLPRAACADEAPRRRRRLHDRSHRQ
jgi:hypothetical protein